MTKNNQKISFSLRGTSGISLETLKKVEKVSDDEYCIIFKTDKLIHYIKYDLKQKSLSGYTSRSWNLPDISEDEKKRLYSLVYNIVDREETFRKLKQ